MELGDSIPQALSMNLIYQTPHVRSGLVGGNKVMRQIFSDWQVSAVMRYQSGALITAPGSNNNLGTYLAGASTQYMTRVPGQPLYLADPNGKIDPTKQLLLNPAAWTECGPTATFGCGALRYTDFRQRRSPKMSAGGDSFFGQRGHTILRIANGDVQPSTHRLEHRRGNRYYATRNSMACDGLRFMNVNNIAAGTARNMLAVADRSERLADRLVR
jgi:hypothetical protein